MARSGARRQKQLERKRAKWAQRRKAIAKREPQGRAERMAESGLAGLLEQGYTIVDEDSSDDDEGEWERP